MVYLSPARITNTVTVTVLLPSQMLLKGVDGDIDDRLSSRRNSFNVRNDAVLSLLGSARVDNARLVTYRPDD
jgi:hypothetical protein